MLRTRELILYKALKWPEYVLTKQNPECLVFLHLPKTGGTSLTRIIQKNYNPWRTVNFIVPGRRDMNGLPVSFANARGIDPRLFGKTIQSDQQLDCITGHLPYGIHRFIDKPCQYMAILRDPVSLVWSKFNHLLNRKTHYLYPILEKYQFDLPALLHSGEVFELIDEQARMLTGVSRMQFSEDDLPGILHHVSTQIELLGTMETFTESVKRFTETLGWRHQHTNKRNVGKYQKVSQRPDKTIVRAIEETNKVDIVLYQYVRDLVSAY